MVEALFFVFFGGGSLFSWLITLGTAANDTRPELFVEGLGFGLGFRNLGNGGHDGRPELFEGTAGLSTRLGQGPGNRFRIEGLGFRVITSLGQLEENRFRIEG